MPSRPRYVVHPENVLMHRQLMRRLPKLTGLSHEVVKRAIGAYWDAIHTHLSHGGEFYGQHLGLVTTRVLRSQRGQFRTVRFVPSSALRRTVYKKLSPREAEKEIARHPNPRAGEKLSPARKKLLEKRGGGKVKA